MFFYNIDTIAEHLPTNYRIYTYYADLEGLAEYTVTRPDTVVLQFAVEVPLCKLLPFIKRKTWANIGEVAPSIVWLTAAPIVVIYKKHQEHFQTIKKALEGKTPFRVLLEGE